jgi:predicted metal-binding membrane protein
MALLFAVGVMNLLWVAAVSGFVLLEKISPANQFVSRFSGLLFIGWAAWIAFAP